MFKWIIKLFGYDLEFKLSKMKNDERILYLANTLMNELEVQGYSTKSTKDIYGFDVSYHINSSKKLFRVQNILAGWEIDGERIK